MFKFLKEKLKETISSIGKKVDEGATEEEKPVEEVKQVIKEKVEEEVKKEVKEKRGFFSFFKKKSVSEKKKKEKTRDKIKEKKKIKKEIKEEGVKGVKEEIIEEKIKEEIEKEEKKLGIFGKFKEKIITKKISEDKFEDLFVDLEITLLENNFAFEVVEKLKKDLKKSLVDKSILRKEVNDIIRRTLRNSISELFVNGFDLMNRLNEKKPFVIVFLGINGGGKTTTLAKIAHSLLCNKKTCVLVAADTFRSASIEQLEEHGRRLGVRVIKHDYGSDPGAVAFDGIKHAEAKKVDVVLIDTAGRLHSNKDLMREVEKIIRVAKPDLKIFVGETLTGNDCINQSTEFDKAIGIDGIILTKADVDDKGGAIISISYVTKKPILYLGTGQLYTDLEKFNPQKVIERLGL